MCDKFFSLPEKHFSAILPLLSRLRPLYKSHSSKLCHETVVYFVIEWENIVVFYVYHFVLKFDYPFFSTFSKTNFVPNSLFSQMEHFCWVFFRCKFVVCSIQMQYFSFTKYTQIYIAVFTFIFFCFCWPRFIENSTKFFKREIWLKFQSIQKKAF